jgi:TRAP transporter TAXI family solute receptor
MAIRHLSWREALIIGIPALLVVVAAFWLTARYVKPAPPDHITMATGPAGGAYQHYAEKYRAILARNGVTLTLVPSAGSVENLDRLKKGTTDVAFVQGGIAAGAVPPDPDDDDADDAPIQSLGALYPEPLWVFGRKPITETVTLSAMTHERIAIGPEGSGTRALALALLRLSGVDRNDATLSPLTSDEAVAALERGDVDVLFMVVGPSAPIVADLLKRSDIRAVSMLHSEAFARNLDFVTPLTVPRGVIDIKTDLPDQDISTVAVTANLLVRSDLHPALMYLLLDAASEIHGHQSLLADAGTYPNAKRQDVPVAAEAERFYRQGKPFLQRYLPFWMANLIDRMLVLLIPLFAVLIPAIKFLPDLYTYRLKSRIMRGYGELRVLEKSFTADPAPEMVKGYLERLDAIEQEINDLHLPRWYASEGYRFRAAIDLVRERLGHPDAKILKEWRQEVH